MCAPSRRKARGVGLALTLVGLVALGVFATYSVFTSRHPGANDFYSRWVGGCALLREGADPYSEAITLRIQEGMYGRPARPEEDQAAFAYPVYSLLFFFPLCIFDNYAFVQAMWFWLLLVGLITMTGLWMQVIRWHPRPWLWVMTILWTVFMYHSFRALVLGQFAILVSVCLVASMWALWRGQDGWAGAFLAATTMKPQMVYLAIPWMLLWAAGKRRWKLWGGFAVALALLVTGSMILLPSWIPSFYRQLVAYPSYTVYGSLTWIIVQHWLGLGSVAEIVVLVGLALCILVLGWRLWRGTWEQMVWMLGLLLLLTNFLTPRIATANYVLLIPWALLGFRWMQRIWGGRGTQAIAAVQVASMLGLWLVFLTTIRGDSEQAPVFLPFPAAILLFLIWLWRQMEKRGWSSDTVLAT